MNDLFSEDNKEIKSYRALLVGEGLKFKDDEEMAKGKYFADADIAIKNRQLDEMRDIILQQKDELNKSKSLEELLDQLEQQKLATSKITPAKEVTEPKPMTTTDTDDVFYSRLEKYEALKSGKKNLDTVDNKLKEIYGDKAGEFLKAKMNELDLSQEDINALARKSPAAFYNTLGLNQKQTESFQTPPRSELRNDSFKPNVEKRTWSWYKTKYKNRDFITNKDINVQMAKDAAELGDSFYDGDFYNRYHKQA